jgi:hypothetical protein
MNPLLLALSLLKVGLYTPAAQAPLLVSPYLAIGAHQSCAKPWGLELGFTEEMHKHDAQFFGKNGQRYVYLPTYMVGVSKGITDHDVDVAAGVKFVDKGMGGYVGISFRLGSAVEASKDSTRRPLAY